ncbi:MAG: prepilin-type N-terminal cleavage/methylation domain-containing protein, partial [Pseudomonadota bacterium]|nr:prepilin-type N-terminal cleavage/methylation domain-containing protein [Pseudomonadota bacterium]
MNSRGFTLLEVLVAVAISATVGIAAVQLLSNIS